MADSAHLRQLSWSERRLLLEALLLLPLTGLALWLLGLRRWQAALARFAPVSTTADGDAVERGQAAARLVDVASRRGPYRATCLSRSLVLWWLLRRRGIAADLRIGVRKEAEQLRAHAWVEFRGVALNDEADVAERYAPFGRAITPAGGSGRIMRRSWSP